MATQSTSATTTVRAYVDEDRPRKPSTRTVAPRGRGVLPTDIMSRRGCLCPVLLSCAVLCRGAAFAAADPVVRYHEDRLSVHAADVPVPQFLDVLGARTGATIAGPVEQDAHVSAEFDDVPLNEGLERAIGKNSFALIYDRAGRLRAVKLLARGSATAVAYAPPAPKPAASPLDTPYLFLPIGLTSPFQAHAPIPVDGALAKALGTTTATFEQLVDATVHDADPAVRAEAIRVAVTAVDQEDHLRDALTSSVGSLDDALLARLVDRMTSGHGEEVLRGIAEHSGRDELRSRSESLLRQLKAPQPAPPAP